MQWHPVQWHHNKPVHTQVGKPLHIIQSQRFCWGDADLQIAKFLRAWRVLHSFTNISQCTCGPVEIQVKTIPPCRTLDSAAIGRG